MKKTIKEVYDLIKEKQYNSQMGSIKETFKKDKLLCLGESRAYQDVLSLIESSHLLEEEKIVKAFYIIKNKKVNVALLFNCKNIDEYNWCVYQKEKALTQEEYDLLMEVLK